MTTVCQGEAKQLVGLNREEIANDLGLHLRDMSAWEARAEQRLWERESQIRLKQAFAAE